MFDFIKKYRSKMFIKKHEKDLVSDIFVLLTSPYMTTSTVTGSLLNNRILEKYLKKSDEAFKDRALFRVSRLNIAYEYLGERYGINKEDANIIVSKAFGDIDDFESANNIMGR